MLDENTMSPELKSLVDAVQILDKLMTPLSREPHPGWDLVRNAIRHLNKNINSLLREGKNE